MGHRIVSLALLGTLLAGCQSTLDATRPLVSWTGLVADRQLDSAGQWAIDNSARIYVARPDNPGFDDEMHGALARTFEAYYPRSRPGLYPESLEQGLLSARYAGMDFIVYPRLRGLQAHAGLDRVLKEEIFLKDVRLGSVELEILIIATQGEQIVDHLRLNTRGGVLSHDAVSHAWPPLARYLARISQYGSVGS